MIDSRLTKYSAKQICPSSSRIMYCIDKKPRVSMRTDVLVETIRALTDGFNSDILYLQPYMTASMSTHCDSMS